MELDAGDGARRSGGIVPLSVADMEFKNPPEIIEGLKAYLDHTGRGYAAPTHSFYEAVLSWTKRRYGWETKKEWLITWLFYKSPSPRD